MLLNKTARFVTNVRAVQYPKSRKYLMKPFLKLVSPGTKTEQLVRRAWQIASIGAVNTSPRAKSSS